MNHWKETADIVSRLRASAALPRRAALATVVRTTGSAYRRAGAKLLILETGETIGGVSGGCLESDVCEVARTVIDTGRPTLRHYDAGDDEITTGLGLGCSGQVDVFIQPATSGPMASLIAPLDRALIGDSPIAIATVVAGNGTGATIAFDAAGSLGGDIDREIADEVSLVLGHGRSSFQRVADRQVFIEVLSPPPHLLVCGAGTDSIPLVAYAADAGFRVTVLDHREGLLDPSRFPLAYRRIIANPADPEMALPPPTRSLAVVKTHSWAHDREWVRLLAGLGALYVGVLGPRDRTERMLADICAERGRVFGPVGLDIGADGAHQVAISIVAELLAFVSKREPRHLRQRREAIHVE